MVYAHCGLMMNYAHADTVPVLSSQDHGKDAATRLPFPAMKRSRVSPNRDSGVPRSRVGLMKMSWR